MSRSRPWLCGVMALLALTAGVAAAQQAPGELDLQALETAKAQQARLAEGARPSGVVLAGPIDPETYLLGPGDRLELNLWGRLQRTLPLDVSPEGRVFVPGKGSVDVRGKTLAWARARVMTILSEQYVGVHGDIRLVQLRTFKVFVSGEVQKTGAVEANSAWRASEAIADAVLTTGASRRNIVVRHADGTTGRCDLDQLEKAGRQEANPLLVDGDVLMVPRALEFVEAAGAVSKPSRIELAPGDSLSTLLVLSGGLVPSASADHALLVRFASPTDRESLHVDLNDPASLSLPLRDGDHLFISYQPEFHRLMTVGIVGEVMRPGGYPIVPGRDRLSDLMRWAGGFLPNANKEAVHLVRDVAVGLGTERDPEFDRLARLTRNEMTESEYAKLETNLAERKNSFRVDWTRLEPGGPTDPLLQDNDVIRVDRFVPTVRIEGQVKRPGFVDYAPGRTLDDYVRMAGGFTDRSAKTSVRVSRGLTGQIIPARSLKSVQPGDFIWVPERRDVDAWVGFRDIIAVASQVAVIIFTLSQ